MTEPPAATKKTARTFDFQAMMEQARLGAQERSTVDWDSEIEKAKEDNDARIAQMRSKADEAAKKMYIPTDDKLQAGGDDDDDFGPSLALASASTADDDGDSSSDDDDKNQARVSSMANGGSTSRTHSMLSVRRAGGRSC